MRSPRSVGRLEVEGQTARLAVLIDADNAQASVIEGILAEVARHGEATVKRIYGDFTSSRSSSWKGILQKFAIKPVQQFAYTSGKNATDSALIIDAMDLLYTAKFDGFCLVTSDSDFTGLATRLREEGLRVLGFGEQKTPDAFRNACDKFIFTEVLRPGGSGGAESGSETKVEVPRAARKTTARTSPAQSFPRKFLLDALEQSSDDDGWAQLARFGRYLNKLKPDFDSRVYGYKKLSDLVKAKTELFVTEERAIPGQSTKNLYLRAR
jgi:NYN domain/OST-HTH/LOTUS domain